ncbi:MAG: ribulose-phosphate 3-epimerase [bacterium]
MIKLSPSILSADFMKLNEEIKVLIDNGVKYIHLDVMDGLFVPNISIGMPVIKSLKNYISTNYPNDNIVIDAHFMIVEPERYIDEFINLGCDIINFHFEGTTKHQDIIDKIKASNKKVGMTIKPATDYKELLPYINDLDLILVMGVQPGFGGQSLIESTLGKVSALREYIQDNNLECELEIDGGIKLNNVERALEAGADVIVVGSDIFESKDKAEVINEYNKLFEKYS